MEEKNYEKYNHPGYVEQLKPETKYTSRKVQVDGITLYDSEASFRRNFLKKHLKNTVAAFAAGLYWLTEYRGFMFVYAAVMAESLADSVASKIGPLTDGRTVDICTFRPAQAGISGAVSLSGTLAALMGSICIGLLWLVSSRCGSAEAALVAVVGFLGCMFDSMLGSRVQVRYRCTCCGKVTERNEHCGAACIKEKGIVWMNNDAVNLLSNVFALVLALAAYVVAAD